MAALAYEARRWRTGRSRAGRRPWQRRRPPETDRGEEGEVPGAADGEARHGDRGGVEGRHYGGPLPPLHTAWQRVWGSWSPAPLHTGTIGSVLNSSGAAAVRRGGRPVTTAAVRRRPPGRALEQARPGLVWGRVTPPPRGTPGRRGTSGGATVRPGPDRPARSGRASGVQERSVRVDIKRTPSHVGPVRSPAPFSPRPCPPAHRAAPRPRRTPS